LIQVKEKEFLLRPLGCSPDGAQLWALALGARGGFITLKGTGTIILDGKRIVMPEATCIRVAPKVNGALANDSKNDVVFMILGALPPQGLSAWRQSFDRRRHS
jgi:hypothetical protein